jgi:hypothetical protein
VNQWFKAWLVFASALALSGTIILSYTYGVESKADAMISTFPKKPLPSPTPTPGPQVRATPIDTHRTLWIYTNCDTPGDDGKHACDVWIAPSLNVKSSGFDNDGTFHVVMKHG